MQPVLGKPRGTFSIDVETLLQPRMANEVVDGAKSVELTTDLAAEQGVKPTGEGCGTGDLKCFVGPHRSYEFLVAGVRQMTTCERDSNRPWLINTDEIIE